MTSVNTTGLSFWKLTTRWSTCNSKIKKNLSPGGTSVWPKDLLYLQTRVYTNEKALLARKMVFFSFLLDFDMPLPLSSGQVTSPHRQCFCMSSPFRTCSESSFYSEPCDGAEKRIPYDVVSFFPPWHYSLLAPRHRFFKSHDRMLMRYIPHKHLGLQDMDSSLRITHHLYSPSWW